MDGFILILILAGLIIITFFIGLYLLLKFLYKFLERRGLRKLGLLIIIGISLWFIYMIYTAIYPIDRFYYAEFKRITFREVPQSSKILRKSASYPGFHGDYCSAALFRLSLVDYKLLLNEIENDNRLSNIDEIEVTSSEFHYVIAKIPNAKIKYSFKMENLKHPSDYYFIGFMDDKQTIVISLCQ
jgi:hypothetical protein